MRRRLIQSTLAVVLVVIAVFGVSLVIVETRTISNSAQDSVESEALRLVSIVESRLLGGGAGRPRRPAPSSVDAEPLRPDRRSPAEPPIEVGDRPAGSVIRGTARRASRARRVTVEESRSAVTREVGRTLLIIGAVALLAVVAAVLLAVRQANRLASPLTDLAETAERLGSGDPRPRHKRYGVPELDRVADVLDSSAERIARMLTAERRLAADASHQLRTPLTALSMRLEEITVTDDPDTVQGGGDDRADPGGAAHRRGAAAADQLPRPAHRLRRRLRPRRGRQAAGRGVAPGLPQRGPGHRPLRQAGHAGRRHPGRGRPGAGRR